MLMLKYLFCWTNFLVTSNLSHFNGISHVCAHRLFLNNYTANGSLMIVSQVGSISTPNLSVSSVYDILDTMRALTTATCTPLMLSTPLIGVPHLSYNTKYYMNYCMIQFPIRSFLKFLVYVCFVPLQPHEHVKLQPHSPYVVFLVIELNKKSIGVMIALQNGLGSLVMWSFWNTKCIALCPISWILLLQLSVWILF